MCFHQARIASPSGFAGSGRICTYTLEPLPSGGTKISFEYAWQQAPLSERLASPLVRAVIRRGNERAMERLAEQLAGRRNSAGGE
jgi:hypothetical protein